MNADSCTPVNADKDDKADWLGGVSRRMVSGVGAQVAAASFSIPNILVPLSAFIGVQLSAFIGVNRITPPSGGN